LQTQKRAAERHYDGATKPWLNGSLHILALVGDFRHRRAHWRTARPLRL